ncbi:RidA family protein [Hydrogenobacter hydrogenophilus]|uniref:2-iminobutanoate/2-iminopropanoate deaminase n=1 Tax=Hydrogenobacter hydrogenophilus TaxID=35835 RepID=A0A285NMK9_9AQUI|nr:Rid family detoxifying hydrolase [Hydrogenobacter hydrogenophilus]SNZ10732.1 2-iminobutanoate/2-iminopropanoate deaminase [Hydrogenobacter hydrogenophilus]
MKKIHTREAPKPVGPYSQAVIHGNLLFVSGQIGIDPKMGRLRETFEEQVKQIFTNIDAILRSAGADKKNIAKVSIYITDLSLFPQLNALYEDFFKDVEVKPARTTVGVNSLPMGAYVEMDIIAVLGQGKE